MEGLVLTHKTSVMAQRILHGSEKHEDTLRKENSSYVLYTVVIISTDSCVGDCMPSLSRHVGIICLVKSPPQGEAQKET